MFTNFPDFSVEFKGCVNNKSISYRKNKKKPYLIVSVISSIIHEKNDFNRTCSVLVTYVLLELKRYFFANRTFTIPTKDYNIKFHNTQRKLFNLKSYLVFTWKNNVSFVIKRD